MDNFGKRIWNELESFLKLIVRKLLRLSITDEVWNNLVQFVKFGIVGLSNTVVGYLIYTIALKGLRMLNLCSAIDIYIAQVIMFILSVAWSFYWNNRVVFSLREGESRSIVYSLMKTYISYAFTSLFLCEVFLHIWVNVVGISEFVAPIINLVMTVPLNYLIQKFGAFN